MQENLNFRLSQLHLWGNNRQSPVKGRMYIKDNLEIFFNYYGRIRLMYKVQINLNKLLILKISNRWLEQYLVKQIKDFNQAH